MIRHLRLLAPAIVLLMWAGIFAIVGRTDTVVVTGCLMLAAAMIIHVHQEVSDWRNGHHA